MTTSLSAREEVNIKFDKLQISKFIKLVAKLSHTNILVTKKINGTVDMITSAPVYDDELMGILVSVLESKGFTLIKNGSYWSYHSSEVLQPFNIRCPNCNEIYYKDEK